MRTSQACNAFRNLLVDQRSAVIFGEFRCEWQDVLVESLVQDVQLGRRRALHVEPPVGVRQIQLVKHNPPYNSPSGDRESILPVTRQGDLRENRSVGTEKARFAAVEVAVVPHLTAGVGIAKESFVALLLAAEARLGNVVEVRVVNAWPTAVWTRASVLNRV
jgi:hypothetical protein